VVHEPSDEIPYKWFSYVPSGLPRDSQVYILITGIHGQMANYDISAETSKSMLQERLRWPNINKFILLVPVIPREENQPAYPAAFDLVSFRTSNSFYKQADLKVNLMIDKLIADLNLDGYQVSSKVMVEGFSTGGMFAQRYALLHPDRVKAIAAGQCGGNFTLPETSYQNTKLKWPVGINNLFALSGIEFNQDAYKQVSQFIFIGDKDTGENYHTTVWIRLHPSFGTGNMWESVGQMEFLIKNFGETDPVRLQNEIDYLNSIGYENIEFKLYPGIDHTITNQMINDLMKFLVEHAKN
jgi:poly(3-hydroxybutyrate) depolymerase